MLKIYKKLRREKSNTCLIPQRHVEQDAYFEHDFRDQSGSGLEFPLNPLRIHLNTILAVSFHA